MNLDSIEDKKRDAGPSIRGFFFQILHTLDMLLDLKNGETLAIELGEDITKLNEAGVDFNQIKHTAQQITLTTPDIQEFIVNSFNLWKKTNKTSSHTLLTTSRITTEADRTSPWLSGYKGLGIEYLTYLKNKQVTLKGNYLAKWNELVQLKPEELVEFFEKINISSNIDDYSELIEEINQKIKGKYPKIDAVQMMEKLVFYLFNKASEDGLKLLTKDDISGIASQLVNNQSSLHALVNEQHQAEMSLINEVNTNVKKVVSGVEDLSKVQEVKPIIILMDENLKNDALKTVLNIGNTIKNKIDSASKEMKFRYYEIMAKAHHGLSQKGDASLNYREASLLAPEESDSKYYEGWWNLSKEIPNTTNAKKLAEEILTTDPRSKKGFRLLLNCPVDDLDEIIKKIPDTLKEDTDIAALIAYNYNLAKDFTKAASWAEKSISSSKIEYRVSAIEYQLVELLKDVHIIHNPSPSITIKEKLAEFKSKLQKLWDEMKLKEIAGARTSILAWIANIEFLLNDPNYLNTIEEAIKLSVNKNYAKYLKAQFLLAKGYKEEGSLLLMEIKDPVTDLQGFELTIKTNSGLEDLIKELEEKLNDVNLSQEFKSLRVITFLRYVRTNSPEELNKQIERLKSHISVNYINFFKAIAEGDKELSEKLESIKRVAKEEDDKLLLDLIMYEFERLENFEKVLEILQLLQDKDFFTVVDLDILHIAKNVESQDKYYSRLEDYIRTFGNIPQILLEKLPLDAEINDKKAQVELIEEILKEDSKNLYLLIQRAYLLVEQGKQIDIKEIEQVYNLETDPLEYAINLAVIYSRLDRTEDALDLMYKVRRKHPLVQILNQRFIAVMNTFFRNNHPEWTTENIVKDGYAVTLVKNDKESTYILESTFKDQDLLENEINSNQELFKKLIGKKVGDEIEGLGKITLLRHKYVALYQKLLEEHERYLPEGSVKKFDIPKNGETPDFSEIFKELKELHYTDEKLIKIYKDNSLLPLSALGKSLGKKYLDIYGWALTEKDIKIRCADGTVQESESANLKVNEISESEETPSVVLDMSALFTLDSLDLLDKFKQLFPNILVANSVLDEIKSWEDEQVNISQEETVSLGMENGQPRSYVYSKEFNKKRLDKISNLRKWIEENTTVSATKKILEMPKETRERFANFLGEFAFESVYLADEKSSILVTDEAVLRTVAKNEHNVDGLWIQPVLQLLLKKDLITQEEYNKNVNKLIKSGYQYISINYENLTTQIKVNGYYPDDDFLQLINILKHSIVESSAQLLSQFLVWLYQEPLLPERKDAITIFILNQLKDRDQFDLFIKLLSQMIYQGLYLQPIALEEIATTISTWLKLQKII